MDLDGERYTIRAGVVTIGGYTAHAAQKDLVRFVRRMRKPPRVVRLVHRDAGAKAELKQALAGAVAGIDVVIP